MEVPTIGIRCWEHGGAADGADFIAYGSGIYFIGSTHDGENSLSRIVGEW